MPGESKRLASRAVDASGEKIFDNYMAFRDNIVPWFRVAEGSFDNYLGAALARKK